LPAGVTGQSAYELLQQLRPDPHVIAVNATQIREPRLGAASAATLNALKSDAPSSRNAPALTTRINACRA
jgi:hypothetical protein